ncbi:MAG: exonuclease domain-containing protein [Candidatus Gracilibacteria bacterium]
MILNTSFVIVDLETTGLQANLDNIVEIAGVKVLNGQIVDEWDTLVNPGIFVPQETTDITGITTEMLKVAPRFPEVVDKFLQFLGEDSVFVAHNVEFDRGFVNSHLRREERLELKNPYLCTFKLAKLVHPNLARYGLGALAETFQVDLPQAHRAIHDARATAQLFVKFLNTLQAGGLKNLRDLPGIQNLPLEKYYAQDGQVSLF